MVVLTSYQRSAGAAGTKINGWTQLAESSSKMASKLIPVNRWRLGRFCEPGRFLAVRPTDFRVGVSCTSQDQFVAGKMNMIFDGC